MQIPAPCSALASCSSLISVFRTAQTSSNAHWTSAPLKKRSSSSQDATQVLPAKISATTSWKRSNLLYKSITQKSLPCARGGGICNANDGGVGGKTYQFVNQSLSFADAQQAPFTQGSLFYSIRILILAIRAFRIIEIMLPTAVRTGSLREFLRRHFL